jgi:hypothetical protein
MPDRVTANIENEFDRKQALSNLKRAINNEIKIINAEFPRSKYELIIPNRIDHGRQMIDSIAALCTEILPGVCGWPNPATNAHIRNIINDSATTIVIRKRDGLFVGWDSLQPKTSSTCGLAAFFIHPDVTDRELHDASAMLGAATHRALDLLEYITLTTTGTLDAWYETKIELLFAGFRMKRQRTSDGKLKLTIDVSHAKEMFESQL